MNSPWYDNLWNASLPAVGKGLGGVGRQALEQGKLHQVRSRRTVYVSLLLLA